MHPPSCKGSKHLPRFGEFKHPPQYLQMLFRDKDLLGTLVLKLYVNAIQSQYIIARLVKKSFLSPSRIEPVTYVLSHNISVVLPTL